MADEAWKPTNPNDDMWAEMFDDDIDRERWRTNFGQEGEAAENAAYWRDMVPSIEPSVAAIYHKEGLNPYDVTDYTNAGITDYKELLSWHRVKATPEVVSAFKEKGVTPDSYSQWAKIGVQDPNTLVRLADEFKVEPAHLEKFIKPLVDKELISLQDVPKWLEKGFHVREIGNWLENNFKYPSIAFAWKSLRFKPEVAIKWERVLHRPEKAAIWLAGGYKNIKEIEGLIKQGYESPEEMEREAENLIVKT
ncbi:MAG: hypothetical protein WC495_06475 [Patescibacteria group bacterium]|jgi:hypothetical protein